MRITNNEERASILSRTAREVRSYKVWMRLLGIILAAATLLVGTVYTVAVFYKQSGSFTISIDKYDMHEFGLSLSDNRDFSYPNSSLNAKISKSMTNIAGEDLPKNIDDIDGSHNGANHIAYTFYLSNSGETEVSYEYALELSNVTNGLDEALRVRVYVDGEPTTYAKVKSDGSGEAEKGTEKFSSQSIVADARRENFLPGQTTKFTVVVWIEGNDADCRDTIIGGQLKLDMNISVVH